jgi:hypothetical protein
VIRDLIIYREIIANPETALPCYGSNNTPCLSLSSQRDNFDSRQMRMGFMMKKLALKPGVFLRTLVFLFHESFILICYPHCSVHAILLMDSGVPNG